MAQQPNQGSGADGSILELEMIQDDEHMHTRLISARQGNRPHQCLTAGSERFVLGVLEKLKVRAKDRKMTEVGDGCELTEPQAVYNDHFTLENQLLRVDNGYYRNG